DQGTGTQAGQIVLNDSIVWLHAYEFKRMNKVLEHLHLLSKRHSTAAGLPRGDNMRPVRLRRRERVVEIVEQTAAGHQEVPTLRAIDQVGHAPKTSLVVAESLVERKIPGHGVGRKGVVKVED